MPTVRLPFPYVSSMLWIKLFSITCQKWFYCVHWINKYAVSGCMTFPKSKEQKDSICASYLADSPSIKEFAICIKSYIIYGDILKWIWVIPFCRKYPVQSLTG